MRPILLLLFLFIYKITFSQTKSLPPEVVDFIQKRIEAEMNPSIVVGIIDKDGQQFYSYGKKKKGGKNVNAHTIYEIGSISKVFTSTLLADMVVKGEMYTSDPIEKYLPSTVTISTYEGQHITLGNLADHTSGLPRMPDNFTPADFNNPYADYSVEQMYSFLSSYQLNRPVGSVYEYSNLAVGLLGHILALHANKSYEELMVASIARPLGMNESKITLTKKMKKNLAKGHHQNIPVSNWDLPTLAGAGAIRSSAYDMVAFLNANLNPSDHELERAILLTQMPRHDKAGSIRVGLGWHISGSSKGDIIWHNGATGGYSSFAGFIKETGQGVVVLTNSTESVEAIGFHLLDPNEPLPNILPHISIQLKEVIDREGPGGLIDKYDKIKKEKEGRLDLGEDGINALGYYYLNRKQFDEALGVFMLNIREHPASYNVYDSYAEALMESGQKELAILNYKKSLELNPGNANAEAMLAKMNVHVEIPVPEINEAILESYVGSYELFPGFILTVTRDGKQLSAQATGQNAYPIFPKSSTEFYYRVVDAQIVFHENQDGQVESLTLFQGGKEIVGKKK